MKVKISPSKISGRIAAPPSKSMAHRLLICAGLSDGESVVKNVSPSEDVLATIDCLASLGVRCELSGGRVRVFGRGTNNIAATSALPCRESGSTLRFFIPICLLSGGETTLSGSARLFARPLGVYEKMCRERSLRFLRGENSVTVKGPLFPGRFTLEGNVSSQFVSGLLFALPALGGDSEIVLTGGVESRPYIDMTLSAIKKFGVAADWSSDDTIFVAGNGKYTPADVYVEGDCSNAAFFEALNALGGSVTVTGIDKDTVQGDKVYADMIAALKNGTPTLSLADCPDLGPILFALAAELEGATFTHTRRLREKESDRIASMCAELEKFGAAFDVSEDSLTVRRAALHSPAQTLSSHNDHRVAMALSVLLTKYGGVIDGAESVKKSMPDFYDALASLGAEVNKYDR